MGLVPVRCDLCGIEDRVPMVVHEDPVPWPPGAFYLRVEATDTSRRFFDSHRRPVFDLGQPRHPVVGWA